MVDAGPLAGTVESLHGLCRWAAQPPGRPALAVRRLCPLAAAVAARRSARERVSLLAAAVGGSPGAAGTAHRSVGGPFVPPTARTGAPGGFGGLYPSGRAL